MNTDAPESRAETLTRILAIASTVFVAALIYVYRPEESSANVLGGWLFLLAWGVATTALIKTTATLSLGMRASKLDHAISPQLQLLSYGVMTGLLISSIAAAGNFGLGIEPEMLCWPVLISMGVPALIKRSRRDKDRSDSRTKVSPAVSPPT